MISVKADIDAAERLLSDLARQQLPFATAMALNDTAQDVKVREEQALDREIDRPTRFTRNAIFIRRASKRRLVATVAAKDIQAQYLRYQVEGGIRPPKGRAIPVPSGIRLNVYGNMARGAVARALGKRNVFATSPGAARTRNLPPGVYERRRGGALKLLVSFEPRARYSARWDFRGHAVRAARANFERNFIARLREAIATAR